MDEFIKLGGYLVEGQPEVSHDNTLSGNGLPESPLGVVGGAGKTYTGVAPIVVDNSTTTGSISAKLAILSAQSPITLESSTSAGYTINTIKYTGTEYNPVVSAMYMTTGYPSTSIITPVTLRQLRITTPYTYTGPSYYTAQIDGQQQIMDSAAYYDFNKAVTENGIKWVVCCSGNYSLFS